jgi:hypothetical protein
MAGADYLDIKLCANFEILSKNLLGALQVGSLEMRLIKI